jgi:hypothetical protein
VSPKPKKPPPKRPGRDQAPIRPVVPIDEGTAGLADESSANLGEQVEPNQRGGDSKSHLGG